jgi:hypothetical protein
MARMPHNIEKLKYRKDYTGYADGIVFYIHKSNSEFGKWVASPSRDKPYDPRLHSTFLYAFTLEELSQKLTNFRVVHVLPYNS